MGSASNGWVCLRGGVGKLGWLGRRLGGNKRDRKTTTQALRYHTPSSACEKRHYAMLYRERMHAAADINRKGLLSP